MKYFSIIFLTFMLMSIKGLAQTECPGDNDPCPTEMWETNTFDDFVGTGAVNFKIIGSYKHRFCNGVYQIKDFDISIDYDEMTGSLDHFEEALNWLREYAEMQALAAFFTTEIFGAGISVCGEGDSVLMASIYSADCGVWLRCSYEFNCEPEIHSDGPSQIGYICEAPWDRNGKKVVDRWHWEPCGDVCCEKTYDICKDTVPVMGHILKINNVNRHKLAGSECSKEGQFFKWDTMTPIPCKDGCQGNGN